MTAEEKLRMFDKVRHDIQDADIYVAELDRINITHDQAKHLLVLCTKANASCQAFERMMAGVEPPKRG